MTKDQRKGKQIARKVIREMLNSRDHRYDIDVRAERHVENYRQGVVARAFIRDYCRQLVKALREMP